MQEDFRREGIADKGERRGGRSHETNVSPGERERQTEESRRHRGNSEEEIGVGENPANDSPQTRPVPEFMHIAHLLHGAGKDDISYDRKEYNDKNSAPGVQVLHRCVPPEAAAAWSGALAPGAPFLASFARSGDAEA